MKDIALRREYLHANQFCEYCDPLRKLVKDLPWSNGLATCCDHIWGGNSRWDVVSGLIATCDVCHSWKTRHATMGRIVAYSVKVAKGEMHEAEFRAISGQIFRGWLENSIDGVNGELLPGFREVAEALLVGLTKAGF